MGIEATNLTICVPYNGCDGNCVYCVSKMTGYMETNKSLIQRNLKAVMKLADAARVTSVTFTGKGEPFLNRDFLFPMLDRFRDFPTEVQTNGIFLSKMITEHRDMISKGLVDNNLNTLAVSIDRVKQLDDYAYMFSQLERNGITVRVCINLSERFGGTKFENIFEKIKQLPVRQLLIRCLSIPERVVSTEEARAAVKWINRYAPRKIYDDMYQWFTLLCDMKNGSLVRKLPHGAEVWDIDGLSICFSDYCIQEVNNTKDIRSLIWMEDGHVYTAWDKPGSILF